MAASTLGVATIGSTPIAGMFIRATPVIAITAPLGTITSSTVTVTWSYSSLASRAQTQFRVKVYNGDMGVLYYDSLNVASAAHSHVVDYVFASGSYVVVVASYDGFDWSVDTHGSFAIEIGFLSTAVEDTVGSVYEVGINGVGYMLQDQPMDQRLYRQTVYQRQTVPLDAQRVVQGETSLDQAVDRYALNSWIDWSEGAGQRFGDLETSSAKAYLASTGLDPFTPGQISMLNQAQTALSLASGRGGMCLANAKAYVAEAGTPANRMNTFTAVTTISSFNIAAAAGAFAALTSDGIYWYYSDGANVWRNNTNADPGAAWSTVDVKLMEFCSDRLMIARLDGTSSTPNCLVELDNAGAEVAPHKFILPVETTIRSITAGDGYVWFAATRAERSTIFAWKLGSSDSYFAAFDLPHGQEARSVYFYQGNVMIRAAERKDSAGTTFKAIIYRAATQAGVLAPTKVLEISDASVDHSDGAFFGDDRFVYFGWQKIDGVNGNGLGAIDLSTGGWSKYTYTTTGGASPVTNIIKWSDRLLYLASTGKYYYQDTAPAATATLQTSVKDFASSLRKRLDAVELRFDPMPTSASITVEVSLDGGTQWFTAGIASGNGATSASFTPNYSPSDSFQLRLTFTKGSISGPTLRSITLKTHQMGLADQVLTLPVNCSDEVAGLNGRPLPGSGRGAGALRARTLEQLVQTIVSVQDVDWRLTRVTQNYHVVSADVWSVGVFERSVNRQGQSQICTLTLRRSLK